MASALLLPLLLLAPASAVVFESNSFSESWLCEAAGRPGVCSEEPRCGSGEAPSVSCGVRGKPELRCCPDPDPVSDTGLNPAALACEQLSQGKGQCEAAPRSFIEGYSAEPGEFPYSAVLGYAGERGLPLLWGCGGALIDERWVLTTATCVLGAPGRKLTTVRLGDLDLTRSGEPGEAVQELAVERALLHPDYSRPSRYRDIALVRLAGPARRTPAVRPACLLARPPPTRSLVIAGWGSTGSRPGDFGRVLRKAEIPLVPHAACSKTYSQPAYRLLLKDGVHEPSQLCAGGRGRDTCQGDSGSPLVARLAAPHCGHALVALTSFGPGLCGGDTPSLYTRVGPFLPWITAAVWPDQ